MPGLHSYSVIHCVYCVQDGSGRFFLPEERDSSDVDPRSAVERGGGEGGDLLEDIVEGEQERGEEEEEEEREKEEEGEGEEEREEGELDEGAMEEPSAERGGGGYEGMSLDTTDGTQQSTEMKGVLLHVLYSKNP